MHHKPQFPTAMVRFDPDWNPAEIRTSLIDGLQIQSTRPEAADTPHLTVAGAVEQLTLRNVEVVRSAAMPRVGCLLEMGKGTCIYRLLVTGVSAGRLRSPVRHAGGSVGSLHAANILATDLAQAVIEVGDGAIRAFHADGVHSAPLRVPPE